jgi:23S rRNA pseudouridine1911/1915/1917 synthase
VDFDRILPESDEQREDITSDIAPLDDDLDLTPVALEQSFPGAPVDLTVEARAHGWRVDHYLSKLYSNFSRSLLQKGIDAGGIFVNGLVTRSGRRLRVNDRVTGHLPEKVDQEIKPEPIPLDVIFEDDVIVVINKPAGLIVHPGRGNYSGTLANALQFHFNELSDTAGAHRPGIVHRLDRDTTGLLLVAKNNQIHALLSSQFEQRTVKKQYCAIVKGVVNFDTDYIETHMKTHTRFRELMMVCAPEPEAREAITYYEVEKRFRKWSFVRLYPHTGRTHQLRVHMQYIGYPILSDVQYGMKPVMHKSDLLGGAPPKDEEDPIYIKRQALHAHVLEFDHPVTAERLRFEAPIPADMQGVLDLLEREGK